MTPTARKILATAILIPVLVTASRASTDVLADWTFQSLATGMSVPGVTPGNFTAESGVNAGTSIATGLHASSATAWTDPAGNGSTQALSSNNWAIGDYYQFQVSTTGYDTLLLNFDQAISSTGAVSWTLQYSANGSTFTNFLDYTLDPTLSFSTTQNKPAATKTVDLSSISALGNISMAYFRLVEDVAPGSSTSTARVDNIIVTGTTFVPSVDRYWDGNGAAAGLGGSGTWSGTSVTWNDAADGTGNVTALAAQQKAVFKGTAGTITIGNGADANSSIRFESSGYVLSGAGTLNLSAATNRIEVTNASDIATISAALSGSTGLEKIGAGTLVLGGNNTFTGGVKVTTGTLQVDNDSELGDSAGNLVLSGGTLKLTATAALNSNRNVSGNGTLDIPAGGTLTVNGNITSGLLVLANAGALMLTGATQSIGGLTFMQAATVTGSSLGIPGNITTNNTTGTVIVDSAPNFGGARTISVADGSAPVDFRITGTVTSSGAITKVGDGTMELMAGNQPLLGLRLGVTGTTPTNGGVVIIHTANGIGAGVFDLNVGTLRNATGSLLTFTNGFSLGGQGATGGILDGADMELFGGLTVFQSTAVGPYAQRLTANTNVYLTGGLNELATPPTGGAISAGIIFGGTGRVILNGSTNTFIQPITVDGGKLDIIGSLTGTAQGKTTVQNGGLLTGNHDTNSSIGALEVASTGTVAPGTLGDINGIPADSTGTLNTKNLSIDAGGIYNASVAGTGTGQFDQINVTGAVTLAGTITVTVEAGYTPVKNDSFIIINNDGSDAVLGQFSNNAIFPGGNTFFTLNYAAGDGNDVALVVVPEPATAGLALLGGLALAARRRRRA